MSNTDPQKPVNPADSLIAQMAASVLRHALTALSGSLVSLGALQSDQQNQFIAIGMGVAIYGFSQVWSWVQKSAAAKAK